MSLDKFQIPLKIIPELYKDSLVVLDEEQIKPISLQSESIRFLGSYTKNILILVNDANAIHLNEKDLQFLTGILSACKLTIADVGILNMHHQQRITFQDIIDQMAPNNIFSFGVTENNIQLPFLNTSLTIEQHQHIFCINAPSLETLSNDVDKKKALWMCLKKIFSI